MDTDEQLRIALEEHMSPITVNGKFTLRHWEIDEISKTYTNVCWFYATLQPIALDLNVTVHVMWAVIRARFPSEQEMIEQMAQAYRAKLESVLPDKVRLTGIVLEENLPRTLGAPQLTCHRSTWDLAGDTFVKNMEKSTSMDFSELAAA